MSEQEQDILALLQRMQQQLTYLEKKLDTLIQKSEQKPFNRPGNFSRPPFRPFGRPQHRPDGHSGPPRHEGGHGHGPGGGFNRRPGGSGGHFAPKKKPFFGRRKDQ